MTLTAHLGNAFASGSFRVLMVDLDLSSPATTKNSLGIEFILVSKGNSWLGGGAGKPGNKEVEFKQDFSLGKYEVTQEQWQTVLGANPSYSRTGQGKGVVQVGWKKCPDHEGIET